jgi:hypothetical protein
VPRALVLSVLRTVTAQRVVLAGSADYSYPEELAPQELPIHDERYPSGPQRSGMWPTKMSHCRGGVLWENYCTLKKGECRVDKGATVKRLILVVASVITLIVLSVTMQNAASAAASSSSATIKFDDVAQQVQLIIPTPACAASQPNCQWKFFLNEPKLSVDVATIYGTSGTLTLAYPKNFCGVIQADAYVGPPFEAKRGFQHTIADCGPTITPITVPPTTTTSTTTTSTTTTTTTTTTAPPGDVVTTPPAPPTASAAAAPPVSGSVAASSVQPPVLAAGVSRPLVLPNAGGAAGATARAGAVASQLPFTGMDVKPFLLLGLMLVALGLGLLTATGSWRRMARRLLAAVHHH